MNNNNNNNDNINIRITNKRKTENRWADGRWANIMRVRSTDRNASLRSLFAKRKEEEMNNHNKEQLKKVLAISCHFLFSVILLVYICY